MHPDQLAVSVGTVRRLLRRQFPEWQGFPISEVTSEPAPWASPAWATRFRGPCRPGHRGLRPGPLQHCWRRRRLPGPADHLHRRHGHGSLLPLPAGLGAVETAMTVGLTVAGTAAAPASAAVLLYRLFSTGSVVVLGWLVVAAQRVHAGAVHHSPSPHYVKEHRDPGACVQLVVDLPAPFDPREPGDNSRADGGAMNPLQRGHEQSVNGVRGAVRLGPLTVNCWSGSI